MRRESQNEKKHDTKRNHTNVNGDERSTTSGQRADDALLANETHVGGLLQGKRQIDKRSLYREIFEIPQGVLSCVLVVLLVARSHALVYLSCWNSCTVLYSFLSIAL